VDVVGLAGRESPEILFTNTVHICVPGIQLDILIKSAVGSVLKAVRAKVTEVAPTGAIYNLKFSFRPYLPLCGMFVIFLDLQFVMMHGDVGPQSVFNKKVYKQISARPVGKNWPAGHGVVVCDTEYLPFQPV
jgi:hypothetical protein